MYLFHSNDNKPSLTLTLEQIKSTFVLEIKSPTRVIFKDTHLDQEWVAANLNEVLDALKIKIETIPSKEKTKKEKGQKGHIDIGGNVTDSNIVIGSNNVAANSCNGVSYVTIGNNLFVGPK